ncbi:hypothetical protein, unknown function [Leishmania tarentolae]|nr:hypothetical protein, unknown function [Leishmania tarentolae]
MERMIARRPRDHIEHRLQPQQSGCRPQRSTVDAIMQLMASLTRQHPQQLTTAVFIDYARTFDPVDHGCILKALAKVNTPTPIQRWIASFLQHRTVRVRVNNTFSKDVVLTCGVPQGSVLGPLLFTTLDSLSGRLGRIPDLDHGFLADHLTIMCADTRADSTSSKSYKKASTSWRRGPLNTSWMSRQRRRSRRFSGLETRTLCIPLSRTTR